MRLIHGDCLQVLPTLGLDPARTAVVTDPPYGRNQEWHFARRGEDRAWRVHADESLAAAAWVRSFAAERSLPLVLFMSPDLQLPPPWQQLLVWDKGEAVGGGGDVTSTLKRTWEMIGVERVKLHAPRRGAVFTHHVVPQDFAHHRCEKPVPLLRELIRTFVPPGWTVLDPFMGSGTTGVAAVREGRDFVGVEIDAHYFAVAQKRIAEAEACRDGRGVGPLFERGLA